jgi:enoyl-CoA hydratase
MTYANILVETHGAVGLIRLNRPQALNALSAALMEDLNATSQSLRDANEAVSARSFAQVLSIRPSIG